jgi:hypothetical protein
MRPSDKQPCLGKYVAARERARVASPAIYSALRRFRQLMSRTALTVGLLGILLLVACAPTKHATRPTSGPDVAAQAEPAAPATLPQAGETAAAPAEAKAQPPAPPLEPVGTARPAPTSAPAPSSAPASRPAAVSSTKPALAAKPAAPAPSAQAAPQPAAPAIVTSNTRPTTVPAPAATTPQPPRPAAAAPAEARPAAAAALDLHSLQTQLRETKAIGVFTKIALKNQVDDLLDRFRAYYRGESKTTLSELRQGYNLLLMKVLSLLQDGDPSLAKRIVESREAIWGILADPTKFSQNNLMAGG